MWTQINIQDFNKITRGCEVTSANNFYSLPVDLDTTMVYHKDNREVALEEIPFLGPISYYKWDTNVNS